MGNRVIVKPFDTDVDLVSIRSIRKGAKPHIMGAVSLKAVTVTVAGLEGDMLEEFTEARELDAKVLVHFVRLEHTDRGFIVGTVWDEYVEALDSWIDDESGTVSAPEFPATVTGNTYRAAYVCGSEFYVA